MINQKYYLSKLNDSRDNGSIKIISGMRYVGKSRLLDLYREQLIDSGVPSERIISYDFEGADKQVFLDGEPFAQEIVLRVEELSSDAGAKVHVYLFLDEIGKLANWAKAVSTINERIDCDIYIAYTGYLGDITAQTRGLFSEVRVYPVPLNEYLKANGIEASLQRLQEGRLEIYLERYMKYGALPISMLTIENPELEEHLLQGMLNTIIVKDVICEGNIRDIPLLDALLTYLAQMLGQTVSVKQISDHMTKNGRKTMPDTIDSYLQTLENSGLICGLRRFDVKADEYMKTGVKYYFGDTGLRNLLLGYCFGSDEALAKNVVYSALCRKGYAVDFCRNGASEVDFIVLKGDDRVYVQFVNDMRSENGRKAALKLLCGIKDNYRKIIISKDMITERNIGGIECTNILEFLLQDRV